MEAGVTCSESETLGPSGLLQRKPTTGTGKNFSPGAEGWLEQGEDSEVLGAQRSHR